MDQDSVLLLGNGVNRIHNTYSWENLLRELVDYADKSETILIKDKPFPLLYEEIVLRSKLHSGKKEEEIKKHIAELSAKLNPNNIHRSIMLSGFTNILTTNYDYTLENAGDCPSVNCSGINETKYSIFRRQCAGRTTIWHIHGEEKAAGSILLGYEHYAAYIQQMRNYVNSIDEKDNSVSINLPSGTNTVLSWLDIFFTKNIYILGLSLDYTEIDLWWLLTYRARGKHLSRYSGNKGNRLVYICRQNEYIKNYSKMQVLESMGVHIESFDLKSGNWERFYEEALEYIAASGSVENAI